MAARVDRYAGVLPFVDARVLLVSRLADRPEIRGFVWFNHDKEADWRIQSSTPSRLAYARGVAAARYRG